MCWDSINLGVPSNLAAFHFLSRVNDHKRVVMILSIGIDIGDNAPSSLYNFFSFFPIFDCNLILLFKHQTHPYVWENLYISPTKDLYKAIYIRLGDWSFLNRNKLYFVEVF